MEPQQNSTFSNSNLSINFETNGKVTLARENGQIVSINDAIGWSIVKWMDGTRIPLNNIIKTSDDELSLRSDDEKFHVKVAIIAKEHYIKFELIHVSNNPETGELDDDWPGHRVDLDIRLNRQPDNWRVHTLLLNPMSELRGRDPGRVENWLYFAWPYPQWAQTNDRPQPQAAIAVFGFNDDSQHDDILAEIWENEESLPRPNRANITSWTKEDVNAWIDRCEAYFATPLRQLSVDPSNSYDNLIAITKMAGEANLNGIYLSQHSWQGDNIGDFQKRLFPGGPAQALEWRKLCDSHGINIYFHGFSHLIRKVDPYYGRGVVSDDLAKSARGVLLEDVPAEAKGCTFLVEPDWDFYLGMKEGMLPFNIISQRFNGGRGGTYPPYYENMASVISLNKNLYAYTASLTADNKWKIVIHNNQWARISTTPLVDHKKGDTVEFILMSANQNYFLPDSRSDLLVQQAIVYSKLLNIIQTGDGYDGAAWTEDLGSWGLRRFSQEVYERMDHPGGGASSFGIIFFGHFENLFRRIQKVKLNSNTGNIPVFLSTASSLAPSLDDACKGAQSTVNSRNIGIRAIHGGISIDIIKNFGLWKDMGDMLHLWSDLKPHLQPHDAQTIAQSKNDFYVASETEEEWKLVKFRAMIREGIDGTWNSQPERPLVAPRQYLKANGETISGLMNPYPHQENPVIELHVMANMSSNNTENVSLMPTNDMEIINPDNAEQRLEFNNGTLTLSRDNSNSNQDYKYYTQTDTVGHWLRKIDMSNSRGISITVNVNEACDGSVLVFSTGGFSRYYAVDVDFVGEKTIEIPNGEVVNNREGWDIYNARSITQFDYATQVDRFRLYLHKVPAGKNATIQVTNIEAMKENRTTGLINPEITLNDGTLVVNGTIPYNHYLTYSGNDTAKVYDANWNFMVNLSEGISLFGDLTLTAVNGSNTFSVATIESQNTWLSCRIKVEDVNNSIIVPKPE